MSTITFHQKGDFKKIDAFFKIASRGAFFNPLKKYGKMGVEALKAATPVDTGNTANSWSYEIEARKDSYSITWTNSNINDGVPIAIILQYGHGTRNGGYVQGIDYINPALKPIFDAIAEEAWKEVEKS